MEYNYFLRNILKIRSNLDLKEIVPSYFAVDRVKNPDLIIEEKNFEVDRKEFDKRLGVSISGGKNTLLKSYELFGMKLLLKNLLQKTEITFTPGFRKYAGVTKLIRSLLILKLLQKRYAFVQASCLSEDGKGFLVGGWQNTGKTSTVLSLLNNNFDYLSDDLTIVDGRGNAYCFPFNPKLFLFTNRHNINLRLREKAALQLRAAVANIPVLRRYVGDSAIVDITRFAKIADNCRLKKMFLLETAKDKGIKRIGHKEATEKMLLSMVNQETTKDEELILAYCYINSIDWNEIMEKQKRTIRDCFSKLKCYEVSGGMEDFPELIREVLR